MGRKPQWEAHKGGLTTMDGKKIKLEHWQIIAMCMMAYDIVAVNVSYFIALWLRFDCIYSNIPEVYFVSWIKFIPIYSAICLLVFWHMKLYKSVWQFASFSELTRVTESSVITSVSHTLFITLIFGRMPTSYYCIGTVMQFILIMTVRFSYRFVILMAGNNTKNIKGERTSRVMLIGAGNAGQMILRDIRNAKELNEKVCCIIDDNSNKWHRFIDGVEIVGGRNDILANVKKYKIDKIYVAVPSATAENRKEILTICNEAGCELKSLPGLYQLVNGEVNVSKMKNVEVEDLLGREPIKVNMDEIFSFIKGKVILVTGGGGSIGSELCRQIAGHNPKQLIIFDIYENNAHAIKLELKDNYPDLNLVVLIGSVRDSRKLDYVFSKYKPDVVYHAAAHKHVPLMEDSPDETIKNNALGTYKTAYAAMMNNCQRFVLISTDKAVNPTNIMGASKRLCEMVIQTFDKLCKEGRAKELPVLHVHTDDEAGSMKSHRRIPEHPRTEFVAVRFGNVLGSNGSVIPRFKEQIAKGGPVTVTHPDIIRYFMTIPEAVSLVLQAGTYAKGGEIFVLDMGAPVKIDTLARNLIKLSGYKPDVDIKVEYTGLRPGEKLYEEKLMSEEGMRTTPNNLIHIGSPIPFDTDTFIKQLQMLMNAAYNQSDNICELVEQVVPTYHPAGRNGSEEKGEVFEKQMKVIQGYAQQESKRAVV
jgi:FlaA1/EpsC-like NDP-sugar epimerase